LGGLKRRIEVRGSPGHQEQGKTRKRAKARTGVKAHGRAPTTQLDQAGQQCGTAWPCWVARPCHIAQPGRATWHDRATGSAAGAMCFAIFCFRGSFSFSNFSLLFLLL